jgi:putrescine transport system permease protein
MRRFWLCLVAAWLLLFVAAPLAIVVVVSFAAAADRIPPYGFSGNIFGNYALLSSDPFYLNALAQSLLVSGITGLLCLLIGYPMALGIARSHRPSLLLMLVILPFWTGFLLRITAWIGLLKDQGWINTALLWLRVIDAPAHLLYTPGAMYAGMVYCYLPFMVLPLYAQLSRLDPVLEEAGADLGEPAWAVFWRIIWPQSLPGVVAGLVLVFIPTAGEYVIPELLGGPGAETIGRVLWTEFFDNHDWPMAASAAVVLIALLLPASSLAWRRQ